MRSIVTDRNIRRMFVLVLFIGLAWWFRHLALLLVFFVVFSRTIGFFAGHLAARTKWRFNRCVLLVLVGLLGAVGLTVTYGVVKVVESVPAIKQDGMLIAHRIRASHLYAQYRRSAGHVGAEQVLEQARHHGGEVLNFTAELGRSTLYVLISLIFAVVFLLERDELLHWREAMPVDSAPRILLRYLGHVCDAIAITLNLQLIVALVNTAVTSVVILALGLPGFWALVAMLLVTGLIPVVGGPIAGGVLMALAFVERGPVGLGVFVVSTFFLHKVESYYLNPRLTAKHVKLPGFVIIISLILFEHTFGLVGLFLSFPCLYVAVKIREGWADPELELAQEAETTAAMRGVLPKLQGFRLRPGVLSAVRDAAAEAHAHASAEAAAPAVSPVVASPEPERSAHGPV